MNESQTTVLELVQSLEHQLTSSDPFARAQGVEVLAERLEQEPVVKEDASLLFSFLLDRLQDKTCVGPCSKGLLALHENFSESECRLVIERVLQQVDAQGFQQSVRGAIYQLFLHLWLKCTAPELVDQTMQMMEGERDPRNLLICFKLIKAIATRTDISKTASAVFDGFFCYFPITFKGQSRDLADLNDLRDALSECFEASYLFSQFAMPLLLEKLGSSNSKLDTIQILKRVSQIYQIQLFFADIWLELKADIVSNNEFATESIELVAIVLKKVASVLPTTKLTSALDLVFGEFSSSRYSKLLFEAASSSRDACIYLIDKLALNCKHDAVVMECLARASATNDCLENLKPFQVEILSTLHSSNSLIGLYSMVKLMNEQEQLVLLNALATSNDQPAAAQLLVDWSRTNSHLIESRIIDTVTQDNISLVVQVGKSHLGPVVLKKLFESCPDIKAMTELVAFSKDSSSDLLLEILKWCKSIPESRDLVLLVRELVGALGEKSKTQSTDFSTVSLEILANLPIGSFVDDEIIEKVENPLYLATLINKFYKKDPLHLITDKNKAEITKALVVKMSPLGFSLASEMISKMDERLISLFQDDQLLRPGNCSYSRLYKQRLFDLLVQVYLKNPDSPYLQQMVLQSLEVLPVNLTRSYLNRLVALVTSGLNQCNESSVKCLQLVFEENLDLVFDHLDTILHSILRILTIQNLKLQVQALQFLSRLPLKFKYQQLCSWKPQVLKALGNCLDSNKRVVRSAAASSRMNWFLLLE